MKKSIKESVLEIRRSKITKVIISTIAMAGALSVAMVLPNVVSLLDIKGSKIRKKRVEETLIRLSNKGFVSIKIKNGQRSVELTEKGQRFALSINEGKFRFTKPEKWNGKWHVLIFDIPEKKRSVRDSLRDTLNVIGFVRLQDSVWVYPYNCEDLISLLKLDFKLGKEMLYLVVDKIENDSVLKRNFELE